MVGCGLVVECGFESDILICEDAGSLIKHYLLDERQVETHVPAAL